jgi:hypothetical protein
MSEDRLTGPAVGKQNRVESPARGATEELRSRYASNLDTRDKEESIASHVIRVPGKNLVAVGCDREPSEQIAAFVDALHWRRFLRRASEHLTFCIYTGGSNSCLVLDAVSTLFHSLSQQDRGLVSVLHDDEPAKLSVPEFNGKNGKWAMDLGNREGGSLPVLAAELQAKAAVPSFRWYRNVTEHMFSGRVEGLQVCTIQPGAQKISFGVGKIGATGNESKARKRFVQLAGAQARVYGREDLESAINLLKRLAEDRGTGDLRGVEREHHLESRILRTDLIVNLRGLGRIEVVIPRDGLPFQFPAMWSDADSPRLIDVVGRLGETPWLLELKEFGSAGQGQYYRHGIAQAVLYRHFVRSAQDLHFWFKQYGLDPAKCEAAVAFPELRGRSAPRLREEHGAVAKMLGVHVIELPPDIGE